jgi:DNA-binding NarL/FixJ family response regulator
MRRVGVSSNPLELLTPRQREVLQLIAQDYTTKEMAKLLDLSVKSVEVHRGQLMNTLDIHDVPGLVRFAVRHGLVSAEV